MSNSLSTKARLLILIELLIAMPLLILIVLTYGGNNEQQ
jgi:hypothetical protein